MISTVPPIPSLAAAVTRREPAVRSGPATAAASGRKTRKVLPFPGALSTVMKPPLLLTMPWTAARPRPRPVNLVVKKGSKIRALVSSSMPEPLS